MNERKCWGYSGRVCRAAYFRRPLDGRRVRRGGVRTRFRFEPPAAYPTLALRALEIYCGNEAETRWDLGKGSRRHGRSGGWYIQVGAGWAASPAASGGDVAVKYLRCV